MRQPVRSHKGTYVKWLVAFIGVLLAGSAVVVSGVVLWLWALCDIAQEYAGRWVAVLSPALSLSLRD